MRSRRTPCHIYLVASVTGNTGGGESTRVRAMLSVIRVRNDRRIIKEPPVEVVAMTVRRVIGIETEYGISMFGELTANPMMVLSGCAVTVYASSRACELSAPVGTTNDEALLRDIRCFDMSRGVTDPSQFTDEEAPTLK